MLLLPCGSCGPRALAALAMGSCARAGVDAACSCQRILGPCCGLAPLGRWQRAQQCCYLCASRHLRVLRPGRDLETSVCLCIERSPNQPRLLHVPPPICMHDTLPSASVLACSAFLHEQMCFFSCPLHIPYPCSAHHCWASQHCLYPWPLLWPELVSQWCFRAVVNRTV